ncbi:hypothetical protein BC826DRAFT_1015722, partial [Russula brevipes]
MAHTVNPTTSPPSPSPPPTLDTLIPDPSFAMLWNRLEPPDPYSQLHSKFWGVDIAASRRDWWRSQTGKITMGENEIDEESFALDLDIPNFQRSRFWVRKDYVRIYDYCNKYFEDAREHLCMAAPSVVITGQPGIGKFYWINYAIRRRLGEGQPFLWCRANFCYLFVKEGVFKVHRDELHCDCFNSFIWSFSDANDTSKGVIFPLGGTDTPFFNIHVSSPQNERWKKLMKYALSIVIMNPWTKDEIIQAAHIHRVEPAQMKRVQDLFDQYGGIPRICIRSLHEPDLLAKHQDNFQNAIQNFPIQVLHDHISKATLLSFDDVTPTIFMVKRTDLDNVQERVVEPTMSSVLTRLKSQTQVLQHADQVELYKYLASMQPSRP